MKFSRTAFLAISVALYILIQIPFLNWPFIRQWETVSARNACVARNFVKFGYGEPGLAIIHSQGGDYREYPPEERYNISRPLVPPFVLSLWFHVFGITEASYRICMVIIALVTILIFDLLARRFLDDKSSLVATYIFTFNPLVIYYSIVNPEMAFTKPFVLLAILQYFKWLENSASMHLILTLASIFLACNSDWFGYGAALILTLHLLFFSKKNRLFALSFIGMNLLCFSLHVLRAYLLDPTYGTFLQMLFKRSHIAVSNIHGTQGAFGYIAQEAREAFVYLTPVFLVLCIIGLVMRFKKLDKMVLLLPLIAFDEYVFLDMGTVHDFYIYEFMPFAAITATAGIASLFSLKKNIFKLAAVLFLAAAFAQYSYVSYARLTRSDRDFFWKMGLTIKEETKPNNKILVCTNTSGTNQLGFYSDRYITFFYKHSESVEGLENMPKTIEKALQIAKCGQVNYAVVATIDSAREIEYFRRVGISDDQIKFFALEQDDKILNVLRKYSDKEWQKNGFVFFKLKNK